jgi:hypothetical protein
MLRKFIIALILLTFFISPAELFAKTLPAGFSKDLLWFSQDPFFVGDNITISTFVYNSSAYRMQGTMVLKDGTTTIDKRTFIVDGYGGSQLLSFPWVVTPGSHSFYATIERDEFTSATSSLASSSPSVTETTRVKRFADYDRNMNRVGDSTEPPPPPLKTVPVATSATSSSLALSQDPIRDLSVAISNEAPTPVSSVAIPVISTIENIRLSQGVKAVKNLDVAEKRVLSGYATTTALDSAPHRTRAGEGWSMIKEGLSNGLVIRSPLDYLKLLFALLLHFFTTNPYVFYAFLILLIYKLVSLVIGMFR